ncbi:MAG TPA: hypothetical protein VK081_02080 [Planctomycetota bacterium]|nr:hypothetical protein [Planctomycetota bacterium]
MGKHVAWARVAVAGVSLLITAANAGCRALREEDAERVLLSAEPPERSAAICAAVLRRLLPGADGRPWAAGALAFALPDGSFRMRVDEGHDRVLRGAGNARLAFELEERSLHAALDPAVRIRPEPETVLPAAARGTIEVVVTPDGGGARIAVRQRGTLAHVPFAARAAAHLELAAALGACRSALAADPGAAEPHARHAVALVARHTAYVDPMWAALAHVALALCQRAAGAQADAARSLQAALDFQPSLDVARRGVAELVHDLAEPAAARVHERTLAVLPGLAAGHLMSARRLEPRAPPQGSNGWLALAVERMYAGDLDGARRHAINARAGARTPQGPPLALLAEIARRSGDHRLAAELRLCQAQATGFTAEVVVALGEALAALDEPERAARWLLRSWPEVHAVPGARELLHDLTARLATESSERLPEALAFARPTLRQGIAQALASAPPTEPAVPVAMPPR